MTSSIISRYIVWIRLLLLCTLCLHNIAFVKSLEGDNYIVSCIVSYSLDAKPVQLTIDQMNDNYCDCIYTGEDEIKTNACSGYASYPGLDNLAIRPNYQQKSSQSVFTCPKQPDLKLSSSKFNDGICDCCDGADESDDNNICDDQCADILLAQENAKKELSETYRIGSEKRQELLKYYNDAVQNVHHDVQIDKAKLYDINIQLKSYHDTYELMKIQYIQHRMNRIYNKSKYNTVRNNLYNIMSSFTIHELQTLLIHICQLSGEIVSNHNDLYNDNDNKININIKSCIPLRLAGLDYGIQWESSTYQFKQLSPLENKNNDNMIQLADIILHNYNQQGLHQKVWSTKMLKSTTSSTTTNDHNHDRKHKRKPQPRRRLSEVVDHDDDFEDDEDYEDRYNNDEDNEHDIFDEDDDPEQEYNDPPIRNSPPIASYDDIDETTNKDDLFIKMKHMKLSITRNTRFIEQAQVIYNQLDQMKQQQDELEEKEKKEKEEKEESDKEEVDDEDKEETEEVGTSSSTDPMVYTMIRNALDIRTKRIDRGYNFAISALVLIDAIIDTMKTNSTNSNDNNNNNNNSEDDVKHILQNLIINTLYHSEISSHHLYEILIHIIPEFSTTTETNDADPMTCASPWMELCRSRSIIQRNDNNILPEFILNYMKEFCITKLNEPIQTGIGFCQQSQQMDGDTTSELHNIPSDISDGFYGYYSVERRTDDDPLSHIFDETFQTEDETYINQMNEHDNKITALRNEENIIHNKIRELYDSIGYKDGDDNTENSTPKYGPNGELHSIRDMCFEIEAGKYIYEFCMYKTAKQRDIGSSKHVGGTDLGKWTGYMMIDDNNTDTYVNDGTRIILKWENGQKCWNGPHRSAYVYVTCGIEHEILSADEPETCKYVFDMKSPIACDETYKIKYGL